MTRFPIRPTRALLAGAATFMLAAFPSLSVADDLTLPNMPSTTAAQDTTPPAAEPPSSDPLPPTSVTPTSSTPTLPEIVLDKNDDIKPISVQQPTAPTSTKVPAAMPEPIGAPELSLKDQSEVFDLTPETPDPLALNAVERAMLQSFPRARFIELIAPELSSCKFVGDPKTDSQFSRDLMASCKLRFHFQDTYPLKVFMSDRGTLMPKMPKVSYTQYGGDLVTYFSEFLPEWELRGELAPSVVLPTSWRKNSPGSLAAELSKTVYVQVDDKKKRFYVLKTQPTSEDAALYHGLLFPFDDKNLDLYELVKGYFGHAKAITFSRDSRPYLLLSSPSEMREPLLNTLVQVRATLKDRSSKAASLGAFAPSDEKRHLKLMYLILSNTQIRSFNMNQIEAISVNSLTPRGLELYSATVPTLEKADAAENRTLRMPEQLKTPDELQKALEKQQKSQPKQSASEDATATRQKAKSDLQNLATGSGNLQSKESFNASSDALLKKFEADAKADKAPNAPNAPPAGVAAPGKPQTADEMPSQP